MFHQDGFENAMN